MVDEEKNKNNTTHQLGDNFFISKYDRPDLANLRLDISRRYLQTNPETDYSNPPVIPLNVILEKLQDDNVLPTADFKFLHPEIKADEMPEAWGFKTDPNIADLTITLNRLGMYTSASCEGHEGDEPYPQASFWNEEFYKVLAYLRDFDGNEKERIKIRSTVTIAESVKGKMFDVLFVGDDLEKSRKISEKFLNFLRSKAT